MEEARQQLSEEKLRKEELAARRAARQAARLREKRRLEDLRLKGKLKCKACKRKIIDFTATSDWDTREYHRACWLRQG